VGLLAPWFLAALGAVALPLWLHLLRRHRSVPRPFSSLMFFERRIQSSIRHRRLRYLLLLALRLALLTVLALTFAQPFIRRAAPPAGGDAGLTVLAVDQSASMRQGDRLERARREALAVLSRLRGGARVQVLAFAAQVRLAGQATRDPEEARAALAAIEATDSRGSYAELARALRSLAAAEKAPLAVHLFSDMQKTSWPPAFSDLRLPENTRLELHPVVTARLPNWAVEAVSAPRHVTGAREARVRVTVAGYGTEQATRNVKLVVNQKVVDAREVQIPAGGRASVEFSSVEIPHGWARCEVRLEPADSFPADDRFRFALERLEARPVLFVHERREQRSGVYFRAALEAAPASPFRLETMAADTADLPGGRQYALVVLSDAGSLRPEVEDALREYVRSGGSLWMALGPAAAARGRVPVTNWKVVESRYAAREGDRFQSIEYLDTGHPSVGPSARWQGVKFYRTVLVEAAGARLLARLADQAPLLMEERLGAGRVLVFASTFDNLSNDFPLHSAWVPFIDQTTRYLARLEGRQVSLPVDAFLDLLPAAEGGGAVEVIDPRGQRALTLAESATARTLALTEEGCYEVRRAGGRTELVAANADRRESDFELLPADALAVWQNTGGGATGTAAAGAGAERQWGLWWHFMAALLALGFLESLVGNRHLSAQQEDDKG